MVTRTWIALIGCLSILGTVGCSPAKFTGAGTAVAASTKTPDPGTSGSSVPPDGSGGSSGSTTTPSDPKQSDDAICRPLIGQVPDIVYDSLPVGPVSAVTYDNMIIDRPIDAEYIAKIGAVVADHLTVTSRAIAKIDAFAAGLTRINAQSIGTIEAFIAPRMVLVAHSVNEIKEFGANICISAQTLGGIHDLAGKVTLYGRGENGAVASVDSILRIGAYLTVHDFNINAISGVGSIGLENSHLKSLSDGAGEVVLTNSVIDSIDNDFVGVVYLRGTSSIGSHGNSVTVVLQP